MYLYLRVLKSVNYNILFIVIKDSLELGILCNAKRLDTHDSINELKVLSIYGGES